MKVYLAGPMRGRPLRGRRAAENWARKWREVGHEVLLPDDWRDTDDPTDIGAALRADFAKIDECDVIALRPGWLRSAGTIAEIAYNLALDKPRPFYAANSMKRLHICIVPRADKAS